MRPFKQKINIVEASGNSLDLEGTTKFYIKVPQVLGAETFYPMEAAVLNGNQTDNDLLICLDTLIAWNLVPSNFPNVTLDQHFKHLMNKDKKYSSLYTRQSNEVTENLVSDNEYEIPKPPKACTLLRDKMIQKYSSVFKEKLDPTDRIRAPPVRIKIDPTKNVAPRAHSRPYDVPYNLRKPMQAEISDAIHAGVLTPCNTPSKWVHQMFPVPRPAKMRSDFAVILRD